MVKLRPGFALTDDTQYLALTGELWCVFCEIFKENWPRYIESALYICCHKYLSTASTTGFNSWLLGRKHIFTFHIVDHMWLTISKRSPEVCKNCFYGIGHLMHRKFCLDISTTYIEPIFNFCDEVVYIIYLGVPMTWAMMPRHMI